MDGANLFFNNQPAETDIRSRMRGFERRPTVYERRGAGTVKPVAITDIAPTTRQSFKPEPLPIKTEALKSESLSSWQIVPEVEQSQITVPATFQSATAPAEYSLPMGPAAFEPSPNLTANLKSNLATISYLIADIKELVIDQIYKIKIPRLGALTARRALITAASIALGVGLYSALNKAPQPNPVKAVQYSAATAPVSPQDVNAYAVPASQPRLLDVTYLGIHSRVKSLPLQAGQLQAAFNIHDVAWDSSSSPLGEPGVSVIAGQVVDGTNKGVFYKLANLRVGDIVQVSRGDSQVFRYQVMSIMPYQTPSPGMDLVNHPADSARSCLNLVALVGASAPAVPGVNQRVIVYTEQIN